MILAYMHTYDCVAMWYYTSAGTVMYWDTQLDVNSSDFFEDDRSVHNALSDVREYLVENNFKILHDDGEK